MAFLCVPVVGALLMDMILSLQLRSGSMFVPEPPSHHTSPEDNVNDGSRERRQQVWRSNVKAASWSRPSREPARVVCSSRILLESPSGGWQRADAPRDAQGSPSPRV